MKNNYFKLLQTLICILRIFLFPIVSEILPFLIPAVRRRKRFEFLNFIDPCSQSFSAINEVAHVAFHISSEGELEQIRPIINKLISDGKNIELLYTSESVEKKCQELALSYSKQLRIFRMPLVTYFFTTIMRGQNINNFITAKKLVLCRYDFFPELLIYGAEKGHSLYLVNATLKNKENLTGLKRWYYQMIYQSFSKLVTATKIDRDNFIEIGVDKSIIKTFDFRVTQIEKRINFKENKLKSSGAYSFFKSIFSLVERNSRIIHGSAWLNEIGLYGNKEFLSKIKLKNILVLVAPHKLNDKNIDLIEKEIATVGSRMNIELPIYRLKKNMNEQQLSSIFEDYVDNPGIIIVEIPGILCELYGYCGHSFVGGGHGKSIHSVLEPFVAGAVTYCGPRIHRSTEYDFVKEYDRDAVNVVHQLDRFYGCFKVNRDKQFGDKHSEFITSYNADLTSVLSFLLT